MSKGSQPRIHLPTIEATYEPVEPYAETNRHLYAKPPSLYALSASFWEILPSLHARRYRCASAAAHGRVYVAGGCDGAWQTGLRSVERFDPETRAWSILAPLQVGLLQKNPF